MKYLIASDIHGSARFCRELFSRIEAEHIDCLILLGDLLYHGPRNELPNGYAPKEVIAMLNEYKGKLICVRGNCDAEVDQMVLSFPIMADYAVIEHDGHTVFATHGHIYGEDTPPVLRKGDVLLCGHTHIPRCCEHDDFTYINPGSVSIPKEGSEHSYMTLDGGSFVWKRLSDGEEYLRFDMR